MRKFIVLFNLFLAISSIQAQMGIGNSNPKTTLEISSSAANPSSSGSSLNSSLRIQGNTTSSLDFGIMSNTAASWIQSRNSADYSSNLTLKLNPNGENVTIGTTTTGSSRLHVEGNIRATESIRSTASGQLLNSVFLTETDLSKSTTTQNNSTTATDIISYTYTPVSSNSRIWIKFSANYEINGNSSTVDDEIGSQLLVGSSVIQEKRQYFPTGNAGNGNRSVNIFPISGVFDNTSSSSITIKVNVRRTAGDDYTNVFADMVFSIVEIAD